MVRRQAAAVGVGRARPIEGQPSTGHECASLAARAEAEILEREQHRDRERIVNHTQIHVVMANSSHRHRSRSRLRGGDFEHVLVTDARVPHRFGGTEDGCSLLLRIARALGRSHDQGAAAVGDHAAIQ